VIRTRDTGSTRSLILALGLALSLVLGAAAASAAFPMEIPHPLGTTTLAKKPERVVVFDFGALDTLDKLGVDVIALPKTLIPGYLQKYHDPKYVNVGSLQEPDFERIYALRPDLILISGRQSELYEEFAAIAPTLFVGVDAARYMESFEENARLLGRIFEKEAEVEAELANHPPETPKPGAKHTSAPKPSMMAPRRKLRSRYVPLPEEVWASAGFQTPFDVGQQYATWWYENAATSEQRDQAHLLSGGGLPPEIDRPLLQFACETLHEYTLSESQRVNLRDGFHSGIRGVLIIRRD